MKTLLLVGVLALAGCTEVELKKGEETSKGVKVTLQEGATIATSPPVVAATGGSSAVLGEALAALAALAWATERFFSWRLKLKSKK